MSLLHSSTCISSYHFKQKAQQFFCGFQQNSKKCFNMQLIGHSQTFVSKLCFRFDYLDCSQHFLKLFRKLIMLRADGFDFRDLFHLNEPLFDLWPFLHIHIEQRKIRDFVVKQKINNLHFSPSYESGFIDHQKLIELVNRLSHLSHQSFQVKLLDLLFEKHSSKQHLHRLKHGRSER